MNYNSKECLLNVRTESGNIHMSWLDNKDRVIVFEDIPENYPTGGIFTFDNISDYIDSIKDVSWINDSEHLRKCAIELKVLGYPFHSED